MGSGQEQAGGGEGGGGVRQLPEGGQEAEAEGEARLSSRREWREEGSGCLPTGWRMGMRGWREDTNFLPTGGMMNMQQWREDSSSLPTGRRSSRKWRREEKSFLSIAKKVT